MAYDFTALDDGTWTLEVYDDPYDCDAVQELDFNGTLGDALEWARTIAGEGYEVTVFAGNILVACIDDAEVSIFGRYAA